MKPVLAIACALAALTLASSASANVKKGKLILGRLKRPKACFVQAKVEEVEDNMFNGNEKLASGETELGTFQPLVAKGASLSPGKSVLFASDAFAEDTSMTPDVPITDAACEGLAGGQTLTLFGSFGPEAATLGIPATWGDSQVVGDGLTVDLQNESYVVESLSGQKEIGNTGGGASSGGESSSGGASSGGTSSGGTTSGGTSGTPGSSGDDSSSCAVAPGVGSTASSGALLCAGGLAVCAAALRRRRPRR